MNPTTIVYFAELNPDNSISKIIEMSSHLANDTANRFSKLYLLDLTHLRRKLFLFTVNRGGAGSCVTFTVAYSQYTYQVYPSDGSVS